jgi:hypothetical protein
MLHEQQKSETSPFQYILHLDPLGHSPHQSEIKVLSVKEAHVMLNVLGVQIICSNIVQNFLCNDTLSSSFNC